MGEEDSIPVFEDRPSEEVTSTISEVDSAALEDVESFGRVRGWGVEGASDLAG